MFKKLFKGNASSTNIETAQLSLITMLMRIGLSPDVSGLASRLVYPMDDNYPIPPRTLENNLRELSRILAIQISDINNKYELLDKTKHNEALAICLNEFAISMFETSKEQKFFPYIEKFAKIRDKSQELLNKHKPSE